VSVFRCSQCGHLDNTAVTHYWTRPKGSLPLCSLCDPEIKKWHGRFERFKPEDKGLVEGPDGFIYDPKDPYLAEVRRQYGKKESK
jgi:hypothetical protein